MSVILKTQKIKYKDPDSGTYKGINAISDDSATDVINNYLDEHPDMMTTVKDNSISIQKLTSDLRQDILGTKAAVGGPLVASTVAQITSGDTTKVYVYTGESTDTYTNGNWYYHNGTAWVSGGVYNSTAVETDKTLTIENMPADAKVTGDEFNDLKSALLAAPYIETSGKYVNKNNGNLIEDSTGSPSAISEIPVIKGSTVTLTFDNMYYGGNRGYAFYDIDGIYISGSGYTIGTPSYTITVPTNAATMAFTVFAGVNYKIIGTSKLFDIVKTTNEAYFNSIKGFYKRGISLSDLNRYDGYINGNTGQIVFHNDYYYYEMIVFPNVSVKIKPGISHSSAGYAFYDAEYNPISYSPFSNSPTYEYELIAPDNSKFLLFTSAKNKIPNVFCYDSAVDLYSSLKSISLGSSMYPYEHINYAPTFISMFRKIACIGDSLTAGIVNTTYPKETNNIVFSDFSYPANLKKMTGVDVYNLGAGGSTAAHTGDRAWYDFMEEGVRFPTTNFTSNPCDLYIIALGTNDITLFSSFTGTVDASGVLDETTSVGGYCEIIRSILTIQPKAKIFVVTIPKSRNANVPGVRAAANQKIKDIAEYYNCYVIDLETYDNGDFATYYKNGSHNNALGYNLRARQYIAYIDWIINNNLNDFRNVSFIGTNYDYSES